MENKLSYFNKYLKYKNKYIKLQKQLKGGEDKQWGFGVEQEFPIFIKPSEIDKNNINKLGFDVTLFKLNVIIKHIDIKPYYFIFLDFKKILELDEIIKRDRRSLLRRDVDIKEMEEDLSKIIPKIHRHINNFISLQNKTILSTIGILINIYNEYISIIKKYIGLIFFRKLLKIENITLSEIDIIYQDDIIKIYNKDGNIYVTNNINYNLKLESDSGGYEIRSDNFRNTTVKAVVKELTDKKIFIKESLKRMFQLEDNSVIFMDQETMYHHEIYKYSGEPEINITLPYVITDNYSYLNKFKQQHINLMKSLQYLSPLFLASFTGSYPNSFGDNKKYFETSYRFNEGSRILVTNVNNIYNLRTNDILHYERTHETIEKIYRNHYQKFNIRFDNDEFDYKIEFSVNRNANKFDPALGKLFGFEWKIIDQYPIKYVNNITLFVVMLAQHLQDNNINIPEDPRNTFKVSDNSEWPYQLLEDIIYEGWNVFMGNNLEYIQVLKDKLSLDRHYIDLHDNKTAFDLLNSLHHSLFSYYKSEESNIDIIDCFFPNFKESREYDDFYDLPNINRNSYNNMVDMMKKENITKFNLLKNNVTNNMYDEDFDDYHYYSTQQNPYPFA